MMTHAVVKVSSRANFISRLLVVDTFSSGIPPSESARYPSGGEGPCGKDSCVGRMGSRPHGPVRISLRGRSFNFPPYLDPVGLSVALSDGVRKLNAASLGLPGLS